ncbi:MAG: tetratricopeptide repeat protein [Pyrinomonadaceae bacterium MAG19_C2-C3]|nr:tetratricopeptide repeat protein [Pyrinomonadaceae bacterium MAG19_C2-C3]
MLGVSLLVCACGYESSSSEIRSRAAPALPPATPLDADNKGVEARLRTLEERVRADPEDFAALNRLADAYLQQARETGGTNFIALAERAARASLDSVPEVRNTSGLAALTQAEFASHNFTSARDHALRLTELDPGKSYPYLMLGDALLELGAYDEAAAAFKQMERKADGISHASESRQARLAFLGGDTARATRHLTTALALALNLPAPPRETVAWYRWQLGETAFATGDYQTAERHYRDALITFPDYLRAVAGLGRVRAANGDIKGAIEHYEQIVKRVPDPVFVAALGDLYKLAGREKEAEAQYRLVEMIARVHEVNGVLYNRQLAVFYADHDTNAEAAYANATREYEVRRDIYGADAVAWTALKAGKIPEAQKYIKEALRLGTQDARLLYHAGMIERAAGDARAARNYLQQALKLNPNFDPLQALLARKALEG